MDSCILETIFQSTFPLQGTTVLSSMPGAEFHISIHVPIAGNDLCFAKTTVHRYYFNPRSHCRERRQSSWHCQVRLIFQSTFPLQGTTFEIMENLINKLFQSTFPLQGTTPLKFSYSVLRVFQSTFPLQGTTMLSTGEYTEDKEFQSTFPLQGTTWNLLGKDNYPVYFNPRSHCRERRPAGRNHHNTCQHFNPRSHCRERQQTYPIFNI